MGELGRSKIPTNSLHVHKVNTGEVVHACQQPKARQKGGCPQPTECLGPQFRQSTFVVTFANLLKQVKNPGGYT